MHEASVSNMNEWQKPTVVRLADVAYRLGDDKLFELLEGRGTLEVASLGTHLEVMGFRELARKVNEVAGKVLNAVVAREVAVQLKLRTHGLRIGGVYEWDGGWFREVKEKARNRGKRGASHP